MPTNPATPKHPHYKPSVWPNWLIGFIYLLLLGLAIPSLAPVYAQEQTNQQTNTRIKTAKLSPINHDPNQNWGLSGELELNLGPKLKDALNRGLPLQFAWDVVVLRKRWYWSNQEVAKVTLNNPLAYTALTRTYRVQTPQGNYTTANQEEALAYITQPRDWPVLRREQLPQHKQKAKNSAPYQAQLRFRLVLTDLPKPFQISALVNSDWDLYTDWQSLDWGKP